MKAICPNGCTGEDGVVTVIHVTQDALVSDTGEIICFEDTGEGETTHGPNTGNTWTCKECGAEAEVEE